MRGQLLLPTLSTLASACAAASPAAPAASRPETLAFIHVDVVPMDRERLLADQTVVVRNGEIVALGPAAEVEVPRGAQAIEARGRYLLPALCDMHVHVEGEAWNAALPPEDRLATADVPFETFLFPYLANGITTVQVLSGTADELPLRERIARGEVLGPRLILARMIDGPGQAWPPPISVWVATPEEASAAVRQAKAEGYDKMKVYSFLSRAAYDAIVATAGEVGMDVIGHVPMSVSVEHVVASGQKLIAHSEELAKHVDGDYRAETVAHQAELLLEGDVWLIPTLTTTRALLELFDEPARVFGRPEAAYHRHPMQAGIWSFAAEQLYEPVPESARQRLRDDFVRFQQPLVRSLGEQGGKLLAGSDAILPGLVAGFALHRELHELVEVGLTPYEALRSATSAPFEYLNEPERGTIAPGQRSDLVLLDANPLMDVSAAARISGLLVRGRWLAREELERRMRAIAEASGIR